MPSSEYERDIELTRPTSQQVGDKTAICLSLLCIVHCIVLPVFLLLFPSLTLFSLDDEAFHMGMLYLVVPISLVALGIGYRHHRRSWVVLSGALGLAVLTTTGFLNHDVIGEHAEVLLTVTGSMIIALSHYYNARLRQA